MDWWNPIGALLNARRSQAATAPAPSEAPVGPVGGVAGMSYPQDTNPALFPGVPTMGPALRQALGRPAPAAAVAPAMAAPVAAALAAAPTFDTYEPAPGFDTVRRTGQLSREQMAPAPRRVLTPQQIEAILKMTPRPQPAQDVMARRFMDLIERRADANVRAAGKDANRQRDAFDQLTKDYLLWRSAQHAFTPSSSAD